MRGHGAKGSKKSDECGGDGFEVPLLQGARRTLTNNSPIINIEMKRRKRPVTTRMATEILKELGYAYIKTTKSDEIWVKS